MRLLPIKGIAAGWLRFSTGLVDRAHRRHVSHESARARNELLGVDSCEVSVASLVVARKNRDVLPRVRAVQLRRELVSPKDCHDLVLTPREHQVRGQMCLF